MQKKGLIISCTCPLWRYQALDTVPREMRTCKHLQAFLGRELEVGGGRRFVLVAQSVLQLSRVGQVGGEMTRKTYRRLKKQQDEHRLAVMFVPHLVLPSRRITILSREADVFL